MFISLTHANFKREILVVSSLIFSAYHSDAGKCTHVLSTGGAIIPVLETPEVVMGRARIPATVSPENQQLKQENT